MLSEAALTDLLHLKELTKTDKLLLCLAVTPDEAKAVGEIIITATAAGLGAAKKWNISQLLSGSGRAIRVPQGWKLNTPGKERVREIAGTHITEAPKVAVSLRNTLTKIRDNDTRAFVEEAISCFEEKLYRAAVVLSWVGALALLYDHVAKNELAAFNDEAKRRDSKWKDAKTVDDLARMKEYDFLQVAEAISVIGKSVKQELEGALKFRNGCGHPNSLKIGEARVIAHIETLVLNVFVRFAP